MTPGTLLALILVLLSCANESCSRLSGLRQVITRNVTGVRLDRGNVLDIIEEQTCSAALVRLTCRSLHSFIFVLEARYLPNRTDACVYDRSSWCMYKTLFATIRILQMRKDLLKSNFIDYAENSTEFKSTVNRKCSGRHHCRFRVTSDHPEALFWRPANIRIKYACIPEELVYKYCNAEIFVPSGEGGFLQSPGYPLFYLGGTTCEWTFKSLPGQVINITFHDLNIRDHESDGSCVDVVRIRDGYNTLFESCGTRASFNVVSNTNHITLNLISSRKLTPSRGFFLQYKALGCPNVLAPAGSYVKDGTLESRTFLCTNQSERFPDTGLRTRTIRCVNGEWEQRIDSLPGCVRSSSSSSAIEADPNNVGRTNGLSVDTSSGSDRDLSEVLDLGSFFGTGGHENVNMDLTKTTGEDSFTNIVLPTILIAALFIGNAFIVYIIFHYRKRSAHNDNFRKIPADTREELALGVISNGNSQV